MQLNSQQSEGTQKRQCGQSSPGRGTRCGQKMITGLKWTTGGMETAREEPLQRKGVRPVGQRHSDVPAWGFGVFPDTRDIDLGYRVGATLGFQVLLSTTRSGILGSGILRSQELQTPTGLCISQIQAP